MTTWVSDADIERAFEAWSAFPVGASRRPIVMIGSTVVAPLDGFRSTEQKEAFCAADLVPPSVLPRSRSLANGYSIIGADEALRQLEASGDGQGSPSPLHITTVELGTARFATDRGHRELPAWLFSFHGVSHPAGVLAVATHELFPRPGPPPHLPSRFAGRLGASDLLLDVSFLGGRADTNTIATQVVEARHAIAVQVEQRPSDLHPDRAHPRLVRAGPGTVRITTVHLDEPVGDRVLIDPYTWAPVPYLPPSEPRPASESA